jgi:hypothetical protein
MEEIILVPNDQFQPRYVYDSHGNMIDMQPTLANVCDICNKYSKYGKTHTKCKNVMSQMEKAKQKVLLLEFKLFCLRYTNTEPVNLDVNNIDG